MVLSGSLKIKIALFGISIFLAACAGEAEKKEADKSKVKKERPQVAKADFNADSAYHYIEKQVAFGPRVPNTEAHKAAGYYLASKLQSFGFELTEQKAVVKAFNGEKLNITNIIGEYRAELNNRILLFAHWDTRPFADQAEENQDHPIDGANDGASGVGVLLEIARQIQIKQPNIGVDIIFFDAEDYGQPNQSSYKRLPGTWCLGSQYFANNPHKVNYSANFGILLDMVGAKDARFAKEAISRYYAPLIVERVWKNALALGHGNYFINQATNHVGEDDHLYINKILNIPSIDIIQYDPSTQGFAPHWHTHDDNMEVIDKNTLNAVGETVLATIFQEAK